MGLGIRGFPSAVHGAVLAAVSPAMPCIMKAAVARTRGRPAGIDILPKLERRNTGLFTFFQEKK